MDARQPILEYLHYYTIMFAQSSWSTLGPAKTLMLVPSNPILVGKPLHNFEAQAGAWLSVNL